MPTYREQIEATVDEMIQAGRIQSAMKTQYMDMLAKDEGLAQEFAGRMMRGADYTRKTQELAAAKREQEAALATQSQQVNADRAALKQWETETKAEIARLQTLGQENPQLKAQLAAAQATIKNYGLEDQLSIPATTPTTPSQPEIRMPANTQPNQQPAGQWISRDEAAGALRDVITLSSQAMLVAAEHQNLFGKPLTDDLINESMTSNVPLRQLWEQKYNVPGKRAELQAATQAAYETRIREEARAAAYAEMAVDPSRVTGQPAYNQLAQSQIHNSFGAVNQADGSQRTAPEQKSAPTSHLEHVDAAVAAFSKQFNPDFTPRQGGGPATGL